MEPKIVIVAYKPKPGKAEALKVLMRTHSSILKSQDLVTDRPSILMEAKDGTIVEVFEWKSQAAIESAHSNPEVLKMWEKFEAVCDFIPIGKVEESGNLFSEFSPMR